MTTKPDKIDRRSPPPTKRQQTALDKLTAADGKLTALLAEVDKAKADRVKAMATLYRADFGTVRIGNALNISNQAVRKTLEKAGVELRGRKGKE